MWSSSPFSHLYLVVDYETNISGTVNLLNVMTKYKCKNIVFSSSATVYGDPKSVPVKEDFEVSATNPYGALIAGTVCCRRL